MTEGSRNSSAVGIVAILAIVVLVGIGAWFVFGRSASSRTPQQPTTTTDNNDINLKVDLPDTVTIK